MKVHFYISLRVTVMYVPKLGQLVGVGVTEGVGVVVGIAVTVTVTVLVTVNISENIVPTHKTTEKKLMHYVPIYTARENDMKYLCKYLAQYMMEKKQKSLPSYQQILVQK